MPVRKMRVEVYDGAGNRYTITFEGHVTRDKAVRLLDLIELLGGIPGASSEWEALQTPHRTKLDKVHFTIEKHFPIVSFTSKDVRFMYEQELKEPISLSTVSTYLSRMTDRGILVRNERSNPRHYRMTTKNLRARLSFMKNRKLANLKE